MARPRAGRRRGAEQRGPRIGLALAGGGPVGAVYEVAALCALQDALEGVDFSALQVYVGVSSGAFIASMLANRFTPADLREFLIETASEEHAINAEVFVSPATAELAQRAALLPRLALEMVWRRLRAPLRGHDGLLAAAGRAIPTGVFDNERLAGFLEHAFRSGGRSNDFRRLDTKLRLVATDLDTSDVVEFGAAGHDRVPIARAVQASAALPVLYPPVRIGRRDYVDGALRKTLHASVALREGARLVFCINPLVPFDARLAAKSGHPRRGRLADAGLPVVLSQTFRTLIHSRMQVGMASYRTLYKGADVLLFEPRRDDPEMFFTNVFAYSTRHRVFEHAYRSILHDLAARRRELAPQLARHGISIRAHALNAAVAARHPARQPALAWLGGALDRLERWMSTQ
jgi:predicted acylesterase/phospholipase RssA